MRLSYQDMRHCEFAGRPTYWAQTAYQGSRSRVDANRVGAMGIRQGGGILLAVASLDARIRAVSAHVPFLSDMRRAAQIPGALVNQLLVRQGVNNPRALRTLDYFDPLRLTGRLHAPALVSAGGRTEPVPRRPSAPSSTVFRALSPSCTTPTWRIPPRVASTC
ncbi:MAG TPA: acetylxylan esterase [Bryobacteraceae bacterium]|nr:acetylxylan esterase [Bryobacteraceae bacterium]